MIKIVQKPIKYVVKCSNCGCKFEYNLSDKVGLFVKCPECENLVWHSSENACYEENENENKT